MVWEIKKTKRRRSSGRRRRKRDGVKEVIQDSYGASQYRREILRECQVRIKSGQAPFHKSGHLPRDNEIAQRIHYYARIGKRPFIYQDQGIRWLTQGAVRLLHDDPGLGKTMQALAAAPSGIGSMVVCPAAVIDTWKKEAKTWRPDFHPVVLKQSTWRYPRPGELLISSWKCLPPALKEEQWKGYQPAWPWPFHLIIDELHYGKNNDAKRTLKIRNLATNCRYVRTRVGLTGTPLENSPPDLYNVFAAVGLGEVLGTKRNFHRFFRYESGKPVGAYPELAEIIRLTCLRRRTRDVLKQLPPLRFRRMTVPIDQNRQFFDQLLYVLGGEQQLRHKLMNTKHFLK